MTLEAAAFSSFYRSKLLFWVKLFGTRKGLSLRVRAGKYIHTSRFRSRRLAPSRLKKSSNAVKIINCAGFDNGRKDYVRKSRLMSKESISGNKGWSLRMKSLHFMQNELLAL
jgi:hypothetical protein